MNAFLVGALRPVTRSFVRRLAVATAVAATGLGAQLLGGVAGVATTADGPVAAPAAAAHVTAVPVTMASTRTGVFPALTTDTYESRVQYWVNRVRRDHGLGALRLAACPDHAAETWGRFLAQNDEFYHQSMQDLLTRCDATYAGETLARGAVGPHEIVRAWMHSPEHRAVLMSRYPRRIGIGAYPDDLGRWVVAADFMRF